MADRILGVLLPSMDDPGGLSGLCSLPPPSSVIQNERTFCLAAYGDPAYLLGRWLTLGKEENSKGVVESAGWKRADIKASQRER